MILGCAASLEFDNLHADLMTFVFSRCTKAMILNRLHEFVVVKGLYCILIFAGGRILHTS